MASGGLLERAYAHLGVPRRAWAGLKRLPDVAGVGGSERGAFGECVAGHAAQLGAAEGALVWRGGGAAAALASSSSLSDVAAAAAAAAAAGSSPSPSPSSSASDLAALAAGLRMKEGGEREDRGREDPFPSLLAPLPAEPALLSLSPGAAARDDADTDSDLEADVAAEERRRVAAARAAPRSRERGGSGGARSGQGGGALCSPAIGGSANSGSIGSDGSSSVREAMSAALSSQLGEGEVAAAAGATFPAAGAPLPSPSPPSPSPLPPPQPATAPPAAARRAPRPPPSAKAVAAICDLLEGCLATAAAEEGEGLATGGSSSSRSKGKGTTASLSSSSSSNFRNRGSGIAAPVCGWYDARARVALRRVAHWLGVPWPKVANFEHLFAFSLTLPTESGSGFGGGGGGGGGGKKSAASAPPSGDLARATSSTATSASLVRHSAWEKGVKAAQVTGAAVGIGALFALTGGLAAPAVAAGVSAAMTAVGGASAAASAAAASAFLTTGAGTALVAGGVGAGGGAFAGSRMARRVGDVKEFGFVELAPGGGGYDGGDWTGSEEERAGGAVAGDQGDEDGSGSSSSDDDDDDAGGSSDGSDASGGDGGRRRGRRQPLRHPAVDPFLFASSAAGLAPTAAAKGPIAAATSTEDLLEMELKPLRREAAVGVDDDEGGEEEGGGGGEATRELPKAPSSSAAAAETTTGAAAASNGVDAFEALRPPSPPRMGRNGDEDEEEDHSSGTLPRSMSRPSLAEKASQPSLLPPLDGDGDDQRRRDERRRRRRLRRAKKKNSPKRTVVRPYRRPPLPPLLPWPASATHSPEDSRLAVTLCVGGWARRREDLVDVWRARGLLPLAESSSSSALGSSSSSLARRDAERYALVWESEALINLSDVVAAWVRNQAAQGEEKARSFFSFRRFSPPRNIAKKLTGKKKRNRKKTGVIKFALQHWLYAGAAAAAAGPLALVSVSQVIDSAWAMVRGFVSFVLKLP